METENQFQKTPVIIKKLHISTRFKRDIVTLRCKYQKEFGDKIVKEQLKVSRELTKISEKLNPKFQDDLKQVTEKLTTSFLKKISPTQQEIHYLKNKVKNLFEENIKLIS